MCGGEGVQSDQDESRLSGSVSRNGDVHDHSSQEAVTTTTVQV